MAPEQAGGKAEGITPAADVYALGAILYACLTGRPPFHADNPIDTVMQVLEKQPASPRLLNPAIPKDLETVCLKCLEKNPNYRYTSAEQLGEDLQRYLNDEPVAARPVGRIARTRRKLWKHRKMAAALSGAAVVGAAVLFSLTLGRQWYNDWRSGELLLTTKHGPLTGQIFDEDGELIVSDFTIPMTQPVSLVEGEYELKLSATGRYPEKYYFYVPRGQQLQYTVGENQSLWPSIRFGEGDLVEIFHLNDRDDILHISRDGIRRLDGRTADTVWTTRLDKSTQPKLEEFKNTPWHQIQGLINREPKVIERAPDIDGDGIREVVVATTHHGDWGRAHEGYDPSDFIFVLAGASGSLLDVWRFDWADETPNQGTENQELNNTRRRLEMILRCKNGLQGLPLVDNLMRSFPVGDLLRGYDDLGASNESIAGVYESRGTFFVVDLETGDVKEQFDNFSHVLSADNEYLPELIDIIARHERELLFVRKYSGNYDERGTYNSLAAADVDGDGELEVATPFHRVTSFFSDVDRHGVYVFDREGNELSELATDLASSNGPAWRWPRIAFGPDIDNDGWREIYYLVLRGRGDTVLLMVCFSSGTGDVLWKEQVALGRAIVRTADDKTLGIHDIGWQAGGENEHPLLVATVSTSDRQELQLQISALDGSVEMISFPSRPIRADLNGDGLPDCLYVDHSTSEGRLRSVVGRPPVRWRRTELLRDVADLNKDGVVDFVAVISGRPEPRESTEPLLLAVSGSTGRLLWRRQLSAVHDQYKCSNVPGISGDFNGDGTDDPIIIQGTSGQSAPEWIVVSGADGEVLLSGKGNCRLYGSLDVDADHRSELLICTVESGLSLLDHRGSEIWNNKSALGEEPAREVLVLLNAALNLNDDGVDDILIGRKGSSRNDKYDAVLAVSSDDGRTLWAREFSQFERPSEISTTPSLINAYLHDVQLNKGTRFLDGTDGSWLQRDGVPTESDMRLDVNRDSHAEHIAWKFGPDSKVELASSTFIANAYVYCVTNNGNMLWYWLLPTREDQTEKIGFVDAIVIDVDDKRDTLVVRPQYEDRMYGLDMETGLPLWGAWPVHAFHRTHLPQYRRAYEDWLGRSGTTNEIPPKAHRNVLINHASFRLPFVANYSESGGTVCRYALPMREGKQFLLSFDAVQLINGSRDTIPTSETTREKIIHTRHLVSRLLEVFREHDHLSSSLAHNHADLTHNLVAVGDLANALREWQSARHEWAESHRNPRREESFPNWRRTWRDPAGIASQLLTNPKATSVEFEWALEIADVALGKESSNSLAWSCKGIAQYRLGKAAEAIEALNKSIELGREGADTLFVLAMAQHGNGERAQAQDSFDRAIAWMKEHAPGSANLRHLRAEAALVLAGVEIGGDGEQE